MGLKDQEDSMPCVMHAKSQLETNLNLNIGHDNTRKS